MLPIKETTSVCSTCLRKSPATVFERDGRVFMSTVCDEHGAEEALLASDAAFYFRSAPKGGGCGPSGCGVFNHSCSLIFEIIDTCNLRCPTCFAGSSPDLETRMSVEEFTSQLEHLIATGKGDVDVVQLSGGEPTLHPELTEIIQVCFDKGVEKVQINSNGVELGKNDELAARLAVFAGRIQIYLQFDGFEPEVHRVLRAAKGLGELKLKAVDNLLAHGIYPLPVMTVTRGVNMDQMGRLVRFAAERFPKMSSIMLQPAMYSGRYLGEQLFERVTLGDIAVEIERQTGGMFSREDFGPIPCSDPNCFAMAVAMKVGDELIPVSRFFPKQDTWAEPDVAALVARFTDKLPHNMVESLDSDELVDELLDLLTGDEDSIGLTGRERFFVICVKPFMDAATYDQHRVDKCCVHVVDKQGAPVSFCEYNIVRRPQGLL